MTRASELKRHPIRELSPFVAGLLTAATLFLYQILATNPAVVALRVSRLLAGREVAAERTIKEERRWIDEALPAVFVPTLSGSLPCIEKLETVAPALRAEIAQTLAPNRSRLQRLGDLYARNPESWLPGLVLGDVLLQEGRFAEADRVLSDTLRRPSTQASIRSILSAGDQATGGPPDEEVMAMIHLLHAVGYVRLTQNLAGPELWSALRTPISCSRLIGARRAEFAMPVPPWVELKIPAPGCAPTASSLSTYSLYVNLLVGYLANRDFIETEDRRMAAFSRPYRDPPEDNPMLAALRRVSEEWDPNREYLVWAISDAERLLRERLMNGQGLPRDPHLSLNLALLMDSVAEVCPTLAVRTLMEQRDGLAHSARAGRRQVPPRQRQMFDRGLARLEFIEASRRGRRIQVGWSDLALPPEQQEAFAAVEATLQVRSNLRDWAKVILEGGENDFRDKLGRRRIAWLAASRQDLTTLLAGLAANRQESERRDILRLARNFRKSGDPQIAGLSELDNVFDFTFDTPAMKGWPKALVSAVLAGVIAWLFTTWLTLQIRDYQETATSFYRLEIEERLRL